MINTGKNCDHKTVIFDRKDLKYLFSKINWGKSYLDADAVRIMNGERCVIENEIK